MRPRHYSKNLLVFVVPFLAGEMGSREVLLGTLVTFTFFCIASSTVYLMNDIVDIEHDKRHKTKSKRPLANGLISKNGAVTFCIVLSILNLFSIIYSVKLFIILVSYLLIQIMYAFFLKNIVLLDLFGVSSGFVIRASAGGYVLGLTISSWFLVFVFTTSMFIITGKRYSEKIKSEDTKSRKVLEFYTPQLLSTVWTTTLTLSLVYYSLWALQFDGLQQNLALLNSLPLAYILFHLSSIIQIGELENPEVVLTQNYKIILSVLIMLIFYASLIYVGS